MRALIGILFLVVLCLPLRAEAQGQASMPPSYGYEPPQWLASPEAPRRLAPAMPRWQPRPPYIDSLQATAPEANDLRTFHPRRFWFGLGGMATANAGAMYLLWHNWYSQYELVDWQWYNNNPNTRSDGWVDDWYDYVQQDKLGHLFSSWQLTRTVGAYGRWAGLSDGWAAVFGGVSSAFFLTQMEIFDGFSAEYGASRTDLLANYVGATIGGLQVAYPHLEWFTLKYSYHTSPYNQEDPLVRRLVDDYDGISFWLTVRPNRLLPAQAAARWPDWLAVSAGYSGDGLAHPFSGLGSSPEHRRQVFLSPDLDLAEVLDLPEPFQTIAEFLSFVRLPAPALQLTPEVRWYWIYH